MLKYNVVFYIHFSYRIIQADIKSKCADLPSLFALLINVFISRIGLCTRKYQRCSLTFTLITQFICKISKEHIKGKQNSSPSQTFFPALRSLVTYYHDESICSFIHEVKRDSSVLKGNVWI